MEKHVNSICRSYFAQLRKIIYIRKYLTTDATKYLVNSRVTSRLDYCNALLTGVPKTVLNKLQNVQNTDARLVCALVVKTVWYIILYLKVLMCFQILNLKCILVWSVETVLLQWRPKFWYNITIDWHTELFGPSHYYGFLAPTLRYVSFTT